MMVTVSSLKSKTPECSVVEPRHKGGEAIKVKTSPLIAALAGEGAAASMTSDPLRLRRWKNDIRPSSFLGVAPVFDATSHTNGIAADTATNCLGKHKAQATGKPDNEETVNTYIMQLAWVSAVIPT